MVSFLNIQRAERINKNVSQRKSFLILGLNDDAHDDCVETMQHGHFLSTRIIRCTDVQMLPDVLRDTLIILYAINDKYLVEIRTFLHGHALQRVTGHCGVSMVNTLEYSHVLT